MDPAPLAGLGKLDFSLVMPATAFAWFMAAEACASMFRLGRTPVQYLLMFLHPAGAAGLAAQIAFAAFPLLGRGKPAKAVEA